MTASFTDTEVLQATNAVKVVQGLTSSFTGVSTDSRAITPGCLFVALKGEKFDGHLFVTQAIQSGAAGVVVMADSLIEGTSATVYRVDDTLKALGLLARFHRNRFHIPLAAVTGSNGKTTTKELVASIFSTRGPTLKTQGNLNNEIGVPLTLFNLEPTHVAAIVEMGMNHPGEISRLTEMAVPDAGLITIVQPAHLEGVGSIEGVAKAKAELFRGLSPAATAIVNIDDPRIVNEAKDIACRKVTFGRSEGADVRLVAIEPRGTTGQTLEIASLAGRSKVHLHLVGEHNALNATGAYALATSLGFTPDECVRGLEAARPHSHRLELVAAPHDVTIVDDCYNANPASMGAALRTVQGLALGGRAIAVLGDMLELGSEETQAHAEMGEVAGNRVELLALIGPRMKHAVAPAQAKLGTHVAHFDDVAALVAWLQPQLRAKDYVLVKASRGMRLERVVDALAGRSPTTGGH